ncbi:MAG: hypothetical protein QOF00_6286 [Pseudonocardiales bacterium]|nr:hypothetical protein [Pseudonocardiales bacterium]
MTARWHVVARTQPLLHEGADAVLTPLQRRVLGVDDRSGRRATAAIVRARLGWTLCVVVIVGGGTLLWQLLSGAPFAPDLWLGPAVTFPVSGPRAPLAPVDVSAAAPSPPAATSPGDRAPPGVLPGRSERGDDRSGSSAERVEPVPEPDGAAPMSGNGGPSNLLDDRVPTAEDRGASSGPGSPTGGEPGEGDPATAGTPGGAGPGTGSTPGGPATGPGRRGTSNGPDDAAPPSGNSGPSNRPHDHAPTGVTDTPSDGGSSRTVSSGS